MEMYGCVQLFCLVISYCTINIFLLVSYATPSGTKGQNDDDLAVPMTICDIW